MPTASGSETILLMPELPAATARPSLPRDLQRLGAVARDLGELKRMRDQSAPDSVAERLFRRAWCLLAAGAAPDAVWAAIVADALAATRLAGIDAAMLQRLGLDAEARATILGRSFDAAAAALPASSIEGVRGALGTLRGQDEATPVPGFAEALIRQPRAGATAPGRPRLALEPAESHGDHCLGVARASAGGARSWGGFAGGGRAPTRPGYSSPASPTTCTTPRSPTPASPARC